MEYVRYGNENKYVEKMTAHLAGTRILELRKQNTLKTLILKDLSSQVTVNWYFIYVIHGYMRTFT